MFVVYFCDKISEKTTYGSKDSILVHRVGDVSPWPLGSTTAVPGWAQGGGAPRQDTVQSCALDGDWRSVGLDKAIKGTPPVTQLL